LSPARAGAAVLGVALLAACGGTTAAPIRGATPQPPVANSPLPAPPGLVSFGHLTVAADYHFAPQSYVDAGGHAAGLDIDLAGALASQMKLKLTAINIDDPSILPGIIDQHRRYDMGVNQPAPAVATAGAVGLPYFESGQSILAPVSDKAIKGLVTLCGLRVGAAPSSQGELALVGVNGGVCHDNKARVVAMTDDVAGARDVASGKIDALVDDYPAAVLLSQHTSGVRVVPHHFLPSQVDLVFPPGAEAARDAVARALDRLKKEGTYRRLLNLWGLGEGALP
jgi:polar amino acid transport system substrate-binding protein